MDQPGVGDAGGGQDQVFQPLGVGQVSRVLVANPGSPRSIRLMGPPGGQSHRPTAAGPNPALVPHKQSTTPPNVALWGRGPEDPTGEPVVSGAPAPCRDLRVGQHQALEPNQPLQVNQSRISDPCAGQPESLQLVEPCDGLQSRVGDAGVVYRQRLQDVMVARRDNPASSSREPSRSSRRKIAALHQQIQVPLLDRSIDEPDRDQPAGLVDPHTPAPVLQLLGQAIHAVPFRVATTASPPFQIGQGTETGTSMTVTGSFSPAWTVPFRVARRN
ncbi:MAG: hypothetical protein Ct9H300mP1_23150 [Planctomycetaceae bacterium]|nr:MAG: hypothetical protein Ct9H300mP1_23150 [Planctomycetaceae bacterium]